MKKNCLVTLIALSILIHALFAFFWINGLLVGHEANATAQIVAEESQESDVVPQPKVLLSTIASPRIVSYSLHSQGKNYAQGIIIPKEIDGGKEDVLIDAKTFAIFRGSQRIEADPYKIVFDQKARKSEPRIINLKGIEISRAKTN